MFIVAIDGPAGTGKGTIAKMIAERLGYVHIDTGATYRCVALAMIKENIGLEEKEKIENLLNRIIIEMKNENGKMQVYLNGKNVTNAIRENDVANIVSQVSAIKIVRYKMVDLQRKMAEGKNVVMEGRDIGTYVFPNADVKIYLDADAEERARRRVKQNQEQGIECTFEEVLANIQARDKNDKEKEMGALKVAEDAVVVDGTHRSIEGNVQVVEDIINEKKNSIVANKEKSVKKINKKKDSISKIIQREIVRYILIFLYKLIYRVKVIGKENVPKEGSFILCGNHVIPIQVPVIVLFVTKRRVRFMAKHELLKNPIFRWLGYLFDVIPVKRGKQDMDAMKNSLKTINEGDILGIFPEGTTNGLAKKVKVKNGASYMALRTGTKVLPVGIKVSKGILPKIIVNIGEVVDYSKQKSKTPEKEILEKATTEIMDNIIRLTNEAK